MKTKTTTLIAILIVITLGFSACSKKQDGCTDPAATNYNVDAEIDNGTCQYDPRDLYVGDYEVIDTTYIILAIEYIDTTYILTISKDPNDSAQIILEHFWGKADNFVAVLTGSSFSIPEQTMGSGYSFSGEGTFDDNYIFYETTSLGLGMNRYTHQGEGAKQIN